MTASEPNESDEVVEDLGDLGVEDLETLKFEEEGEFVKMLADPKLPKQEEVEKHFLSGHIPYRDWCDICVRCRGREMGHQLSERERNVPEYCWDYCFPGDELGYKLTVLVGKERLSKAWMATAVPMKGGMGTFTVDKSFLPAS